MPIYTLSTIGGKGAQLRLACDGNGCHSGFMMAPGKSRQELINRAKENGFTVTGREGYEKFLCPTCAKTTSGN